MPRSICLRCTFACILFLLCSHPLPASVAPKSLQLTILHTNDTHGHLLPFSYPDTFDKTSEIARLSARRDIGGIARRAALARRVRAEKGHATVLVDAGDFCDGTPFSTEYRGEADVAAMSATGYDLGIPGNHEFGQKVDQLRKLKAMARYPILCANVSVKATHSPLFIPYVIKTFGSARVAFFGLVTLEAADYAGAKGGLQVNSPEQVAARLVPELRRKADLVVAVTHIGFDEDRKLARRVPGIDVIVGGHSHTLLARPVLVASTTPRRYPTVIVQDFQWGGTLGRLDLDLRRGSDGRLAVRNSAEKLLPLTTFSPSDSRVAGVVARYWTGIRGRYGKVIGKAVADIASRGDDLAEYNLVADAVRDLASTDVDLENLGGVRAPLVRGPITYGDLVTMDPFNDHIVTFQVTGRDLKRILEKEAPAVSGVRYVLQKGTLVEATIAGKPIEDDAVYTGATNHFMSGGPAFANVTAKTDIGKTRVEALIEYIRARKVVGPSYDGRRVLK